MVKAKDSKKDGKLELVVLLRTGAVYNNVLSLIDNNNVLEITEECRTILL